MKKNVLKFIFLALIILGLTPKLSAQLSSRQDNRSAADKAEDIGARPSKNLSYPYQLPSQVNASIDIKTGSKSNYNKKQLGLNLLDLFQNQQAKDGTRVTGPVMFNKWKTSGSRFPYGIFSNYYDYKTDELRFYTGDKVNAKNASGKIVSRTVDKQSTVKSKQDRNEKQGVDILLGVYKSNIDMVWTFNMSADADAAKIDTKKIDTKKPRQQEIWRLKRQSKNTSATTGFYDLLKGKGFTVNKVELGNENFYPGQRSNYIPNTSDYIKRAKLMAAALKKKDPKIKVSVNMLRRPNGFNPNWNEDLAKDEFFDAISVHTYVGRDPDGGSDSDATSVGLQAREELRKSIDDFAGKVSKKPIWLSEWGVQVQGGFNAVSALGLADCYLYMSENPGKFETATYFTPIGKLNSFYQYTRTKSINPNTGIGRPIQNLKKKTIYAGVYEIIRDVLKDSKVLTNTKVSGTKLTGTPVNVVNARAVEKGGKIRIVAVNFANKAVNFNLKINGKDYASNSTWNHSSMKFNNLGDVKYFDINENVLKTENTNGKGKTVKLPKFSISVIVLNSDSGSSSGGGSDINSGWYKIKNVATGRYIRSVGSDNIVAAGSGTNTDKQFRFVKSGKYFNIDSRTTGTGKGILRSTKGNIIGTTRSAPLADADKIWKLTELSSPDGTYRIELKDTKKYIYNEAGNGNSVIKLNSKIDNRSKWRLEPVTSAKIGSSKESEKLQSEIDADVLIYPNPTNNNFNIELKGFTNASIYIMDVLGKVVYKRTVTTESKISLSKANKFESGVYIIRVLGDQGKLITKKLFIE
jgi:hypothetical protein